LIDFILYRFSINKVFDVLSANFTRSGFSLSAAMIGLFCEQSRGERHVKPMFGSHHVATMSTDDHLYTPDSVFRVSCPLSAGRCSLSPAMSAFAQYDTVFQPDYGRLVDVYRPFTAPAESSEMESSVQYERHADTMAIRQCRYGNSTSTPGAQSIRNQQDFAIASSVDDYMRQPQSRKLSYCRERYLVTRPSHWPKYYALHSMSVCPPPRACNSKTEPKECFHGYYWPKKKQNRKALARMHRQTISSI